MNAWDMVTIGVFLLYMLILFALIVDAVRTRVKLARVSLRAAQAEIDSTIYLSKLNEAISSQSERSAEETEGFVKFLSNSREVAFQYIEDVQKAILEYREIADIVPLSHDMSVEMAKDLSAAYDKLINFLPQEES